ncbi:sensor histidine kinase YesM [Pedobacter cryoconitis]|uniref:Sensor histidine kinase YesM n=1 Tax=Pedobacter cryoconitis TaxID=188932 RepID=A0A7W8ZJF2_9SPHI|nr:histidine kinase [Pedobacter cryoconitis]MBB5635159.1 sensor histidine kinase YesM [Pedobacter cryoconitis]MBB6271657.1 sensor histidine kinase YesM [Pedobacter cryoconitis]
MNNKKTFKISNKIIWLSSFFLGILTSVPKIAEHHFNPYEALVDSTVTFLFAVLIWYYNILTLPVYSSKDVANGFSMIRLIKGLFFGIVVMFILACIQQYLLSHLNFGPVVLMFEVRGILVNITFYMFLHLLYQSFQNQQVGIELERTKTDNLGAQYELLKQQVNPHFLFNSLNTLKYMVESEDEHSVDFILKLSNFYRFTLESRKLDLIRLAEELEILDAYIYLLKTRFEDGIELSIDINQDYYQSLLPPFTLQLLIENCIKHNIVSLDRPLHIKLYSEKDYLVIENQLQLKKTSEPSTGMGLDTINQRYIHLLNKKIEIKVSETLFTIKLPIIHGNHHH